MLLTKIFKHFDIPLHGKTFVKFSLTDTTNIQTLKQIKIVKEQGQWLAHTKRSDPKLCPSTLPFEVMKKRKEMMSHMFQVLRTIYRAPMLLALRSVASHLPRITITLSTGTLIHLHWLLKALVDCFSSCSLNKRQSNHNRMFKCNKWWCRLNIMPTTLISMPTFFRSHNISFWFLFVTIF